MAIDDNFNCIADSLEQGLALQYLKFERLSDTTEVYTLSYDNLGNYLAYLDTGTYLVTLIPSGVLAGLPAESNRNHRYQLPASNIGLDLTRTGRLPNVRS